jgi:hypothetical protein
MKLRTIRIGPWPFDAKMAFTIRDDDVSYFTDPDLLEYVFRDAWDMGYQTSLAVIPMHKGIDDPNVPAKFRGTGRLFDLRENRRLVQYMRQASRKNRIDVVQHGCTHEDIMQKAEFFINDERELRRRLREGRSVLEDILGRPVSVFSAPHDMISKQAWKVLAEEGMTICRTFGLYSLLRNTPLNWSTLKTLAKIWSRHPHPLKRPLPLGMIDYGETIEIQTSWVHAIDIWSDKQRFQRVLGLIMNHHGIFNLVTHHWQYAGTERERLRDALYALLSFVDAHAVWKTTLTEAARWVRARRMVRTWFSDAKLLVASSETMRGLTLTVSGARVPDQEGVKLTRKGNETVVMVDRSEANVPVQIWLESI